MIQKKTRVIVFIDGSNMFYLQKKLGWMFDWEKLLNILSREDTPVNMNYYEAYQDNIKTKKNFFDCLEKLGVTIITKKLKYLVEPETGTRSAKGNFDVEITKDMIFSLFENKPRIKKVILLSGDSDFAPLIYDLRKMFEAEFDIYAGRKNLSWELRIAADKVLYLEDLKDKIFRKTWGLTKNRQDNKIKPSFSRRSKRSAFFLSKKHAKTDK